MPVSFLEKNLPRFVSKEAGLPEKPIFFQRRKYSFLFILAPFFGSCITHYGELKIDPASFQPSEGFDGIRKSLLFKKGRGDQDLEFLAVGDSA